MDSWTVSTNFGEQPHLVVKLVDMILMEAIRLEASHIFIEHKWIVDQGYWRQISEVYFRVNNRPRHIMDPPGTLHEPIVRRIKLMAGMLLTDPRAPQAGRFRFKVTVEKMPDVRYFRFSVASVPAPSGNRLVLTSHELTGTLVRFELSKRAVDVARKVERRVAIRRRRHGRSCLSELRWTTSLLFAAG